MKGYIFSLLISLVILYGVNLILCVSAVCDFDPLYALYVIILGTLALCLIDLITAIIVQKIPRRWLNPHFFGFKVFKFERKLYESLGIRRWKDKIPELGGALKKFSKASIKENTPEYIHYFITETIYGEMTHTYAIIAGIAIFWLFPHFILNFALPLFLINFVLNILPAMVQRYNRPKLCKMYERALAHAVKVQEVEEENEYNPNVIVH